MRQAMKHLSISTFQDSYQWYRYRDAGIFLLLCCHSYFIVPLILCQTDGTRKFLSDSFSGTNVKFKLILSLPLQLVFQSSLF